MARAVGCMSRQSSGPVKQAQALAVSSFEKTPRFESANQLPGWSVWVASTGIRLRSVAQGAYVPFQQCTVRLHWQNTPIEKGEIPMPLNSYVILGRSGLRVSPF